MPNCLRFRLLPELENALDEAKAVREEVAFMQGVKVILAKKDISAQKKTDVQDAAVELVLQQAQVMGESGEESAS